MSEPTNPTGAYPAVVAQPRYPEIEERINARWVDEQTFVQSVLQREEPEPAPTSSCFL